MFRALLALVVVTASFVVAAPAVAIVAIERDFSDLVQRAEQIIVGTATAIREDSASDGSVYTYVTFEEISVLKGDVGATLTLRFTGGSSETTTSRISDMPTFVVGERAVLFVAGNGRDICPLVGIWQGRFRTHYDASVDRDVVEDHTGAALTGRAGRRLQRANGKRADRAPITLDEFRQLVADELATPSN